MFSVGGKYYTGDPIVYSYMEDRIFEHSRNISIKLHHRIGKFVKLRFSFASRWIMISEITFDSGNYHHPFQTHINRKSEKNNWHFTRFVSFFTFDFSRLNNSPIPFQFLSSKKFCFARTNIFFSSQISPTGISPLNHRPRRKPRG